MGLGVPGPRAGGRERPRLPPRAGRGRTLRAFRGRVVLCFGTFPPERNGGSDFVARLARALAEQGAEPHVLTSAVGRPETVEEDGVVVHRVVRDWTPGREGRSALRSANRLLREADVDVTHVLFPDSVLQGAYQLPAALGLGRVPLVATWWNLGLGRRSPASVRLQSLALLARARVLTSHDPTYLRVLRRAALRRPVEWLPVGNNLDQSGPLFERHAERQALGLEPDVTWIGYFGQLDHTRGVEDLLEALALARAEVDVRLVMIGSAGRPERYAADAGSKRYLAASLALPEALGVAEAVRWTDYLADHEVLRHLRAIDVCVLPYRRNSLGRSALAAALDVGTPTVLAGLPEGIVPLRADEHVALTPPAAPAALASTILRLARDEAERGRLEAGAREAAPIFGWPHIAERALGIYELALRRKR